MAALAILAGAAAALGAPPPEGLLFTVAWGDGCERLGFRSGPEQEPLCVQTWCLGPKGTFLFLDPVARTVKAFDREGRALGCWGTDVRGTSLACDEAGNAYVLDGSGLLSVDRTGRPRLHALLPAPVVEGYGQGLGPAPSRVGELEIRDCGSVRFGVRSGQVRAIEGTLRARAVRRGARASIEGTLRAVDLGSGTGTVLPLASDAAGNAYFEVERRQADGAWHLEVWVLPAAEGLESWMIDTGPCDDVSVLYRRVAVDRDGSIYRARTTGAGLAIYRFSSARGEP